MAKVIVRNVSKSYEKHVLGPCSFTVEEGNTLLVMGPSGSGKSTLLKACAGLLEVEGEILLEDSKRVCVVFDESKCLNHLSVQDNISLGMKKEGYSEEEIRQRVYNVAERVHLSEHLLKRPDECSLGQRQRIALARALVRDFDILLMDEPFTGLDILLRRQMLSWLKQMQKEKGFTCMMVTHDHRDAKILSDQVLILNEGHVEMLDTYEQCLNHPVNEFVGAFLK
ncbi:MAG: ABC transporter ATP-binding protein [Erysipelotrichaceae bacterium]|nr:ABC transporter ATP-binding protein [Erysipelotrichaceae bacterium]